MAIINGTGGNDTLLGSTEADVINGGGGHDSLFGSDGDDLFPNTQTSLSTGYDWIDGGAGYDVISIGAANAIVAVRLLTNVEYIDGAGNSYWIVGSPSGDLIDLSGTSLSAGYQWTDAGGGADTVIGTSGADTMIAWDGNDSLSGGDGADMFRYQGSNNHWDDVDGGGGADTISAQANNTVIGLHSVADVELITAGGYAGVLISGSAVADNMDFSSASMLGITRIDGGAGGDWIHGSSAGDTIAGGVGSDTLLGAGGDDVFLSQTPTSDADLWDVIDGGDGYDRIVATAYNSGITFSSVNSIEEISSGGYAAVGIWGTNNLAESWHFSGVLLSGISYLDAGGGNDSIHGSSQADSFKCYQGDDTLDGGGGNDQFWYTGSSNGFDILVGGIGVDAVIALSNNTVIGLRGFSGIESISANGFANVTILGSGESDLLDFSSALMAGIGRVDGGDGADTLLGTSGADTLFGGSGNDLLAVGGGADSITGGDGVDDAVFAGGAGEYEVSYGLYAHVTHLSSNVTVTLTEVEHLVFDDQVFNVPIPPPTLIGTAGADTLLGGVAGESLSGLGGADTILGGGGSDTVSGGAGSDLLDGGDGDDLFLVSQTTQADGFDIIRGGTGDDRILVTTANAAVHVTELSGVESIDGEGNPFWITGSPWGDFVDLSTAQVGPTLQWIDVGGGSDTVIGTDGDDIVISWDGWDSLSGEGGDDVFQYKGQANDYDYVDGGSGSDTILAMGNNTWIGLRTVSGIEYISANGYTNVAVHGSGENDFLDFSGVTFVGFGYASGQGGEDTIIGSDGAEYIVAELVDGGPGADTMSASTITYERAPAGVVINLQVSGPQAGWGADQLNADNIIGSSHNDYLMGESGSNSLFGGQGNDTIEGATGDDYLDGGSGRDLISFVTANTGVEVRLGQSTPQLTWVGTDTILGFEDLIGSSHRDFLYGDSGGNQIDGAEGDDDIVGGLGDDVLLGGDGHDLFLYGGGMQGFDVVHGGAGNDVIRATADDAIIGLRTISGVETITADGHINVSISGSALGDQIDLSGSSLVGIQVIDGALGADTLMGSGASDTLQGSAGDVSLVGGGGDGEFLYAGGGSNGADMVVGGAGFDTIRATAEGSVIGLRSVVGVEAISSAGFGNVSIVGSSAGDSLDFSSITLNGIAAISGGGGSDSITASSGDDVLIGAAGNDSLAGGDGDDLFLYEAGLNGIDAVDGGQGYDQVRAGGDGVEIGLRHMQGVELVSAGGFSNVKVVGSDAADLLDFTDVALIGLTEIVGGGGGDTIQGSSTADVIRGGLGDDSLSGGEGDDVFLWGQADASQDSVEGGLGYDRIVATADNATIRLSNITGVEEISAQGHGSVTLDGTAAADVLDFSAITLVGISEIGGGLGDDVIVGSIGSDVILLGGGRDTVSGAAGADEFRFNSVSDSGPSTPDLILDFQSGLDKMNVASVDADALTAGHQSFTYIGIAEFSGQAGELVMRAPGPNTTILMGDVDGDALPDFEIAFMGQPLLSLSDLIL